MRTITSPERARQTTLHANYYLRVEVKDSEDNWRDLTNLQAAGDDWVDGCTWVTDIDSPVMTGSITLRRESGNFSLSPLITGSALNKDSHGAYAPLLNLGRGVRISTATTAAGVAPITADWKEVFLGRITDADFEANPISLTIGDIGGVLVDAQIEQERIYGDASGTPVEAVMQQILDDNRGAGVVSLFTPVSPDWNIVSTPDKPYSPARGGLMDGLRALALQIGWDLRYVYDSSNVFRLTFFDPDRSRTTPDITIGPDEYLNVQRLGISLADIRNVCKVNYQDKLTGIVDSETAADSASIDEFDRRYMEIGEGSSSNIDTAVEAQAMADAAVNDLGEPLASQAIEQFYLWQLQLNDLALYQANDVHYDTDQQWAVSGFTHTFSRTTHRTSVNVRGTIAGAYRQWLKTKNGEFSGEISTGPAPQIFPLLSEGWAFGDDPTEDGMAWLQVAFEKETTSIEVYATESLTPNAPIPALSDIYRSYTLQRQEGDKWKLDDVEYIVGISTRTNYYRKIIAIGIGSEGERGPTFVDEARAVDTGTGPTGAPTGFTITTSGTTNRLAWTNTDASANVIVFRNGFGLVLPAGTTAFLDTGLPADVSYTYEICAFKNGQTSAKAGGGSGGTVTPPSQNPTAPVWVGGTPKPIGANGAQLQWTADPGSTEIAIEVSPFVISGAFTDLLVFTDPTHVPNGTVTDTSKSAGTKLNGRVRSKVGGLYFYSAEKQIVWGVPPEVAPKFVNGTPDFDGSSTFFSWVTASTAATKLELLVAGVVVFTVTLPAGIQEGSTTIANATYGGKQAQLRATYPDQKVASGIVVIPTHTGGL